MIKPPRWTVARGQYPNDPSYSITAILPDVPHCDVHAIDCHQWGRPIRWCDDQRCRTLGELANPQHVGTPYKKLGSRNRS